MIKVITEEGFVYKYDGEYFYDEVNAEKFKHKDIQFVEINDIDYHSIVSVYLNNENSKVDIDKVELIISKYIKE